VVQGTLRKPARPLIWIAVAVAALAAAAVAVVLVVGGSADVPAIAPPAPIAVHAGFEPANVEFGDRIQAHVVIALDRRAVRPQTLRFSYGLAPLAPLAPARTSRSVSGDLELVSVVEPLACVSGQCVARKGVTTLTFPPVRATVSRANGTAASVSVRWPALAVRGRVSGSDLASASPTFETNTSPPAPSYRVSPGTLASVLEVLAVVCALGAVGLAAWQAVLFARRRPSRRVDPLERALRLTREAEDLPVPHRRRALGLLARLLRRDDLSSAASDLAWSEQEPEPDQLEALVSEVERSGPA
jgi:hypothetical protein